MKRTIKRTTRDIIESMDYSGGIDWNKMLPLEHEDWDRLWESQDSDE